MLVSSVDGVGTKLRIAVVLGKHDTVGIDIVNHCVDDILTCGAEPLFFLDYIAMGKLMPEQVEAIARGLSQACSEAGCTLIGGETAEMPGFYKDKDYDLVGFIVGVVEKDKVIRGEKIAVGDNIIGLPSAGLHTNGYSLVRRIFGETRTALDAYYPELGQTLGEALLQPHRSYYQQLKLLLLDIKGMAHITGGGLPGNILRVLPKGMTANLNSEAWTVPPIFRLIQQRGDINQREMYRVFNMGIGMVLICSSGSTDRLINSIPEAMVIGEVIQQSGEGQVVIE